MEENRVIKKTHTAAKRCSKDKKVNFSSHHHGPIGFSSLVCLFAYLFGV